MDTEQDYDMGFSAASLAGSRYPPCAMTDDLLTKEERESILKAMDKCMEIDYNWMAAQKSIYYEWNNIKEADKLTKQMNTLLSFWHKVNEEKRCQETVASNTVKSLKRLRSSEDGRETDQDHIVNDPETDMNDTETGANPISTSFKRIKRPDRPQAIWPSER
jgi:GMP synthase PP-ATPase subunit